MASPVSTTAPAAPPSPALSAANVVIVGGGPTGSLAAATLHALRVPCTLLEREPSFDAADLSRSYPVSIGGRGARAVASVDGMYEALAPYGVPAPMYTVFVDPPGQQGGPSPIMPPPPPRQPKAALRPETKTDAPGATGHAGQPPPAARPPPATMFMRSRMQLGFRTFIEQRCPGVDARYGAAVRDVAFRADGTIALTVDYADGRPAENLESRLVLACDGRRSPVLAAAAAAGRSGIVQSARGLGCAAHATRLTGFHIRSLVVSPGVVAPAQARLPPDWRTGHRVVIRSALARGRAQFALVLTPMRDADIAAVGGLLAYVVAPGDHAVWRVYDGDGMRALLSACFPQLDVAGGVSDAAVAAFAAGRSTVYPPVSRVRSLSAVVGDAKAAGLVAGGGVGAVIALGDAAHSFPPAAGQGANSGLEDAAVLGEVIRQGGGAAMRAADVAHEYERRREPDVHGLVEMMKRVWFSFTDSEAVMKRSRALIGARYAVAKLLPRLIGPPWFAAMFKGESYGEAWRNAKRSRRRIRWMVCAVVAAPIVGGVLLAKATLSQGSCDDENNDED